MIGFLFALLAIVSQAQPVPADFRADVLGHCTAVIRPGDFIGCEGAPSSEDQAFAGLLWIPAPHAQPGDSLVPSLETGP